MLWSASIWWWLIAGVLVAAELLTGTFYLLMLALGAAAAALSAMAGHALATQLLVAAVVGGGFVAAWHAYRRRRSRDLAPDAQPLDVGGTVQVQAWHSDGTARVSYRGAGWSARLQDPAAAGPGAAPEPGLFVIVGLDGNCLLLAPRSVPGRP